MQGFDRIVHVNGNIYDIGRASDKDLRFFLKKLYEKQDIAKRNPRALMREIIEPYVKDALDHLGEFPVKRPSFHVANPELQNAIYNNNSLNDATKINIGRRVR